MQRAGEHGSRAEYAGRARRDAAEAAGRGQGRVAREHRRGHLRNPELQRLREGRAVGAQRTRGQFGQAGPGVAGDVRRQVVGHEREDVPDVGRCDVAEPGGAQRPVRVEVERRPRIGVAEQVHDEVMQGEG